MVKKNRRARSRSLTCPAAGVVIAHLFALLIATGACARPVTPTRLPTASSTTGSCRAVVSLEHDRSSSIVWLAPTGDRDRAHLADWCAMVGPIVFEARPARRATRPTDRLAVVTWNTHVGGGDLDALLDAVQRGDYTSGQPLDALVLLLQEMYRHGGGVPEVGMIRSAIPSRIVDALHPAHTRDVRTVAAERGLAVLYAPSMRNGAILDDPEDRGNAILATLPLSEPAAIELPFEHQRRVVAVAAVEGRNTAGEPWRLRLANVHLDTALALLRGGPLSARSRQVDALVTALTQLLPFPGPTILAGDFNAWGGRREPAIETLRTAFPDARRVDDGATWTGPLGLRATLDYVFARGMARTIEVQRLPSRFGSDHYPLLTVITF